MMSKGRLIPKLAGWRERISKRLSGLQFRMSLSYALTSLAAALLIEVLFGLMVWGVITFTSLPKNGYIAGASQAADLYALSAAAQADPTGLNPATTFAPGQPASIAISNTLTSNTPTVPYIASGSPANPAFALLVASDGRVLASSYPGRYLAGRSVAQELPTRQRAITRGLAGVPNAETDTNAQGRLAFAVAPVKSHGRAIGAVYVQVPEVAGGSFVQGFLMIWLVSAIFWLALTLPIGGVFGLITTRGLVHRIHRLVDATSRFAAGDYGRQVTLGRADEVGQLERHFNQMAEQLVESMEQRQTLIAQQARREERARIDQDMRIARNIQQSLLPQEIPAPAGYRFAPYYQPAQEVGGDFYDFHTFEDGRLGIVVGDVSGEGIPAALVMAITRTMLRTAARATEAPDEALAQVNDLLAADMPSGMFVTCFYALLDTETGRLRYANAGHDLPYHRNGDGVCELRARGMPLGMMPGSRYEQCETTLDHGDRVLFYSDGIVEAHNAAREMFGFPRLMEAIREGPADGPLIDRLIGELQSFTGSGWEQEDDVTLLELLRIARAREEV